MFNLTNDLKAGNKASTGFSISALKLILLLLVITGTTQISAQNFFPLQIGNSYLREKKEHNYGHSGHFNSWNNLNYYYDSTSVTDSIIFDNKKFFNYHDQYYHFAESENKLYIKIGDEIKLAVDFSAPAGYSDTLYFSNQKRTYINSGIYIDTVYGEPRQCYSLDRTIIEQDTDPWNYHTTTWVYHYTFVEGIGLFKEINNYNYQGMESSNVKYKTYINIINYINGNYYTEIVPPENPKANLTNNYGVYLKWEYGDRVREAFEIERRREDESEFYTIESLSPNSLSFIDTDVISGYTYFYRVMAINSGFKSSYEKTISIFTLYPPVIVSADTSIQSKIILNWSYNSSVVDGFIIHKSKYLNSSSYPIWSEYSILDTVSGEQRSIVDSNVYDSRFFMYKIYSFKGSLISTSSGEVIASPQQPIPNTPSNILLSLTSDEGIRFEWENENIFETNIVIERRGVNLSDNFEPIVDSNFINHNYTDYDFLELTEYQYRIKCYYTFGYSLYTDTFSVTSPQFQQLNPPVNVRGFQTDSGTVVIRWKDRSDNESGFKIECFAHNYGLVLIGVAGTNEISFEEMNPLITGNVKYRIFAYNPHNVSEKIEFYIDIINAADDEESVPAQFSLFNNYPNPFNPTTRIKYSIPAGEIQCAVKLRIYDVLGNEITTLVDEYKSTGIYEVEFNAEELSSGVYICKLQYGSYSASKKMVLLK